MSRNNTINKYFREFEKDSRCKKVNQITGLKYSFIDKGKKSEVTRFFVDSSLDASISNVKSKKRYSFKHIPKSDLLIIGICLEGKKIIDYKGKNIIEEGDIIYFRPAENFEFSFLEHIFLYYFIDLNEFKKSLYCYNCNKINNDSYGDNICKKGEINIQKVPYSMKSYINEIKDINNLKTDSFSNCAEIKGQLFNYLDWLIKLRLEKNLFIDNQKCCVCPLPGAKKIIMDNLENQITVKEIAEKMNVSVYKLQKSFKNAEGTTVYDFIRKSKIDNSKMLLKESSSPIIEISQKVGYENPSKFSTAFKDITGFTPTEYRKAIQY